MYVLEWGTISVLTRGLFWCLFPELRSNEGNRYQNNTQMSAETVRHQSTDIILYIASIACEVTQKYMGNIYPLQNTAKTMYIILPVYCFLHIPFLHDVTDPQMTITITIFSHCPCVSLALFSFCWWRHNRLLMTSQWPGNCDAITWIVISNSLYIDFIHGDIHGQSCKNA